MNSNRPTLSMAGPASSRCSQEITVPSLGKGSLQCSITADAVVFTYVAISMKRITVETFLRHILLQLATGPRSEFPRSSMTRSSSTEFLFWHLIKIMKTNFPKKMLYIFISININIIYNSETLYILGTRFQSTRERKPKWTI